MATGTFDELARSGVDFASLLKRENESETGENESEINLLKTIESRFDQTGRKKRNLIKNTVISM